MEDADFDAAVFRPLVADDAVLAERLSKVFRRRLVAEMTPEEREYTAGWDPPDFEAGVTPKGHRVLGISFDGGRTLMSWDGSEADALELVETAAAARAYDSETDHWVAGDGWKTWSS